MDNSNFSCTFAQEMINIVKDIDLIDEVNKYDLILLGTNVYNTLGNGAQLAFRKKYPYIQENNLNTMYGDTNKLGTILECHKENEPLIVLLYITKGFGFQPHKEEDYLSYESLEKCLQLVNIIYKGKNIASSFIGASKFDGNGDKDRILEIIHNTLTDVNITIYDYYQYSAKELNDMARHAFISLPVEERHRISRERKKRTRNKPKKYFNGKTKITI